MVKFGWILAVVVELAGGLAILLGLFTRPVGLMLAVWCALDVFGQLRTLTEQPRREPAEVGIEVWVSMGSGTEADWARDTRF
jgi:hypothetical protein